MLVIADLFFVLSQLLLELLNSPVDAPPQLGGPLVADHLVEVLGRSHDFHLWKGVIAQIDGDIEGGEAVEIPLQTRYLGGDLRLRGGTEMSVPSRNVDLHRGIPSG